MKTTTIFIASCLFLSSAAAQEYFSVEKANEELKPNKPPVHFIDQYRVNRQNVKKGYATKHCKDKDLKSFTAKIDCKKEAYEIWRKELPDRGSNGYSEKQYSNLNKAEAEIVRDELVEFMMKISPVAKYGQENIELTRDHISSEILYIERYVLKVEPREYRR